MSTELPSCTRRCCADAFGADAVLIGRPYVFGLAVAGRIGVREVLLNFKADFELTMGLAGCRSVGEIDADRVLSAGRVAAASTV